MFLLIYRQWILLMIKRLVLFLISIFFLSFTNDYRTNEVTYVITQEVDVDEYNTTNFWVDIIKGNHIDMVNLSYRYLGTNFYIVSNIQFPYRLKFLLKKDDNNFIIITNLIRSKP